MDACLLPHELDKLHASEGSFLIHLGDIRDGKPDPESGEPRSCDEPLYQSISTIFESSPVPTFFIPGDNGWLDCADADEAYTLWEQYLFEYNTRTDLNWPALPSAVSRHENHPELFAFLLEDVLFLGQGLPGTGRDTVNAWTPRGDYLAANAAWTKLHFAANAGNMAAVVIFGHASATANEAYFLELEKLADDLAYGKPPILFLEDAHAFVVETGYRGRSNILRIATEDTVTPMSITVDPAAWETGGGLTSVFQYDRGCWCSDGHRPTQLIDWTSGGKCDGVCATNGLCSGTATCSPEGPSCVW